MPFLLAGQQGSAGDRVNGRVVPLSRWYVVVAEFLKEVLQLLLLDGRQVLWYGWLAKRLGGGWWWLRVNDGDYLQGAYILARVHAERLWTVVVDGYPHFGAARERGNSRHKRRQSILGTEVDVLRGPRIVAADQSSGLGRDGGGLEQQCTASGGKVLLLGGIEMDRLRIRLCRGSGAISYVYTDAYWPYNIHPNQNWR